MGNGKSSQKKVNSPDKYEAEKNNAVAAERAVVSPTREENAGHNVTTVHVKQAWKKNKKRSDNDHLLSDQELGSHVDSYDDIEQEMSDNISYATHTTKSKPRQSSRPTAGKSRVLIGCQSSADDHHLQVARGDMVDILDSTHKEIGWIWCRSGAGGEGWVPHNALEEEESLGNMTQRSMRHSSTERQNLSSRHQYNTSPRAGPYNQLALVEVDDYYSNQNNTAGGFSQPSTPRESKQGSKDVCPDWRKKLKGTMVLHTMNNIGRLSQYIVDLLNPYGATTSLHIACWRGSIDAVEVLARADRGLVQRLHSQDGQLTPLHVAVICGYPEVVSFLLDQRANSNIATVHNLRPLHIAASSNYEVTDLLLGAKAIVNARDADDAMPLLFAACHHQQAIIQLLIQAGASVNAHNRWGVMVLHVLCAYGGIDGGLKSTQMLLAARGDPWLGDDTGLTSLQVAIKVCGESSSTAAFIMKDTDVRTLSANAERALNMAELESDGGENSPRFGATDNLAIEDVNDSDFESPTSKKSSPRRKEKEKENKGKKDDNKQEERDNTRKKTAESSAVVDMLKEKNKKLTGKVSSLEHEIQRSQSEHNLIDSKLMHAQATIEKYEGIIKKSEESKESDQKKGEEQQAKDAERLEKILENMKKENVKHIDEIRKKHEEEIQELKRQFQEERDAFEKSLKEAENIKREEGNEKAYKQLEAKERQLKEEKKNFVKLEQEKQKEITARKAAENEVEAHKEMTSQVEMAMKAKEEECLTLRRKIKDLQGQLKEINNSDDNFKLEAEQKKVKLTNELADTKSILEERDKEIESLRKKAEEGEEYKSRVKFAEDMLAPLEERNKQLEELFTEEQKVRKKYHNQLQDLKGAIRVYCRIRPKIKREIEDGIALRKNDAFTVELEGKQGAKDAKKYTFDSIFDEDSSQEMVFAECRDLIQSALDGYNVTIFAYGQTGAGKTHTMYGNKNMPGLVPRTTKELFDCIGKDKGKCSYHVQIYMMELYCNDLVDLLLPKKTKPSVLEIKRDHRGCVTIEGVTKHDVANAEDIEKFMNMGFEKRHVSATKMNSDSSRSHLIVSILVHVTDNGTKNQCMGKITLCDLAGSERIKKSEATGEQIKEAVSINKSLSALGDVIEALTSNQKHIPYRNHKLTEVMSDSLGGNAKTLMFVNCSPAKGNTTEIAGSLGYATRAKQITNQVNKQQDNKEVARLKQVIAEMSKQFKSNVGEAPDAGQLKAALGKG